MKRDEFKKKLLEFGNKMVDNYFPSNDVIINRVLNSTCKYIFKNKIDEFDTIINLFSKNDEIDILDFVDYMQENMIGNGIKINLQDYIQNPQIRNILPNKTLIITKEDLNDFLLQEK